MNPRREVQTDPNAFVAFADRDLEHLVVALDTDADRWTTPDDKERARKLFRAAEKELEARPWIKYEEE